MNKSLYTFLIFLLGLVLASGIFQGIMYFQLGARIYTLDSVIPWFLTVNAVSIMASFLLLKYYHYRKYWFTFSAAVIAIVATTCYSAATYTVLVSRVVVPYYIPILLFSLFAGTVYAVSLVFSKAGKESWLKAGGIFMLIDGLVLISAVILGRISPDTTAERITQWASMAGSLAPVFFIMQFRTELRIVKKENTVVPFQRSVASLLNILGALAFVFTIFCGLRFATENSSSVYWDKQNFEKTKQLAQLFEARIFVNSKEDTLLYRLLKPLNYDPKKKYPLVVCLPYGGQPATDKIRQLEGAVAAQLLSTDVNRKKYPAFIFVPNCPPGSGWGGIPNYHSVDSLVYEAITALNKEPGIDTKRRYVTGLSRGGYGAWNFICKHPELFAAAIPVSGGGDPGLAPKALGVAVWAFHGTKDKNVPVNGSRDMIAAIKKAGGHPKYTEFPNEGHNIWYQVSIVPGLWDWLFAQRRD